MRVILAENIRRDTIAKPLMIKFLEESFFMQAALRLSHHTLCFASVALALRLHNDGSFGVIQGRT